MEKFKLVKTGKLNPEDLQKEYFNKGEEKIKN
jgi:hypothetical protein